MSSRVPRIGCALNERTDALELMSTLVNYGLENNRCKVSISYYTQSGRFTIERVIDNEEDDNTESKQTPEVLGEFQVDRCKRANQNKATESKPRETRLKKPRIRVHDIYDNRCTSDDVRNINARKEKLIAFTEEHEHSQEDHKQDERDDVEQINEVNQYQKEDQEEMYQDNQGEGRDAEGDNGKLEKVDIDNVNINDDMVKNDILINDNEDDNNYNVAISIKEDIVNDDKLYSNNNVSGKDLNEVFDIADNESETLDCVTRKCCKKTEIEDIITDQSLDIIEDSLCNCSNTTETRTNDVTRPVEPTNIILSEYERYMAGNDDIGNSTLVCEYNNDLIVTENTDIDMENNHDSANCDDDRKFLDEPTSRSPTQQTNKPGVFFQDEYSSKLGMKDHGSDEKKVRDYATNPSKRELVSPKVSNSDRPQIPNYYSEQSKYDPNRLRSKERVPNLQRNYGSAQRFIADSRSEYHEKYPPTKYWKQDIHPDVNIYNIYIFNHLYIIY